MSVAANDPALPAALSGRRFVVKLGGEIMRNTAGLHALAADLAIMARAGLRVVVVHGGGAQADALAARLGHRVQKVAGRRVTDDDALEVAKMVYAGSTNVEILGALKRQGARGVGLSGVDGDLITVTRRPPTPMPNPAGDGDTLVDFGHVGDISAVDVGLLDCLLAGGYIPVVASLAADAAGLLYNVNADTIAAALAVALRADKLFLLTNVPGIMRDPTDPASRIPTLDAAAVAALIADGTIAGGMIPKAQNAVAALEAGAARVHIVNGATPDSLLLASFTREDLGTQIVR